MHKLDERTLVTPALLQRLLFETTGGDKNADNRHCAYLQKNNGDLMEHSLGPSCNPLETAFASELLTAANDYLHHDGAWLILFTHYAPAIPPQIQGNYQRIVVLWMDGDGDVHIPVEFEEGLEAAYSKKLYSWLEDLETAYALWCRAQDVLDAQGKEKYHRALGETPPSQVN